MSAPRRRNSALKARSAKLRHSTSRPPKLAKKIPAYPPIEKPWPAVGSIVRTKNLILAALRVWEIKQGIRE